MVLLHFFNSQSLLKRKEFLCRGRPIVTSIPSFVINRYLYLFRWCPPLANERPARRNQVESTSTLLPRPSRSSLPRTVPSDPHLIKQKSLSAGRSVGGPVKQRIHENSSQVVNYTRAGRFGAVSLFVCRYARS